MPIPKDVIQKLRHRKCIHLPSSDIDLRVIADGEKTGADTTFSTSAKASITKSQKMALRSDPSMSDWTWNLTRSTFRTQEAGLSNFGSGWSPQQEIHPGSSNLSRITKIGSTSYS